MSSVLFAAYCLVQVQKESCGELQRMEETLQYQARLANQTAQPREQEQLPPYLRDYQEHVDQESCAWLDIVLFRLFQNLRSAAGGLDACLADLITDKLATVQLPKLLVSSADMSDLLLTVAPSKGSVTCTACDLGATPPVVEGVRVLSWRQAEPLQLWCRITYNGNASISLRTSLELQALERTLGCLPVEFGVRQLALATEVSKLAVLAEGVTPRGAVADNSRDRRRAAVGACWVGWCPVHRLPALLRDWCPSPSEGGLRQSLHATRCSYCMQNLPQLKPILIKAITQACVASLVDVTQTRAGVNKRNTAAASGIRVDLPALVTPMSF